QVLRPDGKPLPGLFAAGEVAGFGGGGMHGYASLEGTVLGGCLFSGPRACRGAASSPAPFRVHNLLSRRRPCAESSSLCRLVISRRREVTSRHIVDKSAHH